MIGIYKITNKINNKIYIGQSIDIERRWRAHKTEPFNINSDNYNTVFYKAIRKYGIDNFTFEVIEECSKDKLNEREEYWINYYNSYVNAEESNGYNMTLGGDNYPRTYDINKVQELWENGSTYAEIIDIVGCSKATLTILLTELSIPLHERYQRANVYKAHPVQQYSRQGELLNEFNSLAAAVEYLKTLGYNNADVTNIGYACNKKITTAYDFIWKYKDDTTDIQEFVNQAKSVMHHRNVKVNQYDKTGKYLATFNTIQEAIKSNNLKCAHSCITNACTNLVYTSQGYIWQYYNGDTQDLDLELHNQQVKLKKQQK